jgi:hypothetical protein
MSSPQEVELHKQYKAAQDKYIYFLLAAAASAIGFAMTQTKTEALTIFQIPLALGVFSWVVSFYSGLQCIEFATSVTYQNFNYSQFKRKLSGLTQDAKTLELAQQIELDFTNTTDLQAKKLNFYGKLQGSSLLFGAFCYIIWHILRMYNLTGSTVV